MFPIIGYPFGPGGNRRCLEVHFFFIRARVAVITTTAKAGPTYFPTMDMMSSGKGGLFGDPEIKRSLV